MKGSIIPLYIQRFIPNICELTAPRTTEKHTLSIKYEIPKLI